MVQRVKQSAGKQKRSCHTLLRLVWMILTTSAFEILSLIQSDEDLGMSMPMVRLLITSSSTASSSSSSSSPMANGSKPFSTSSPPPTTSAAAAAAAAASKSSLINNSSNTKMTSMKAGLEAGAAAGGGNANVPPLPVRARRKRRRKRGKRRRRQDQVEAPPPRPESLHENATVSACLLIRDDNEILPEWLAYHYQVIGLRHLIVAIDPLSSESPSSILQQWRTTTDLEVVEWTDEHFMPSIFLKQQHPPTKYMQEREDFDFNISQEALLEISNHRYRQRVFLAKCMKAHRQQGNSWVMHIDTDEYIVASKLLRERNPDYLNMPNMTQPNSVLRLLQQAARKTAHAVSYPCISMPRVLFGSVESRQEDVNRNVPPGFNASNFETLRWRYHGLLHNMTIHGYPKMILDVAAIPEQYFTKDVVYSVHRPIEEFCPKNQDLTSFRKHPISVNHYLGSWERYAGRNDKRRSREVYDMKANNDKIEKDDGVGEWLTGFCNLVGRNVAAELLGSS